MSRAFWLLVAVGVVMLLVVKFCIRPLTETPAEGLIWTSVAAAVAAMLFLLAARRKPGPKGIGQLMAWYQRRYLAGVLLLFVLELGAAAWMRQKGYTLLGIWSLLLILSAAYIIIAVVLFPRFVQGFREVAQLYSERESGALID